ncbi:MAG: hypothetical protein JWO80_2328 [Bryobacterales bacterium]|nr:hypothetical protein [Bryobacterales bacterium]
MACSTLQHRPEKRSGIFHFPTGQKKGRLVPRSLESGLLQQVSVALCDRVLRLLVPPCCLRSLRSPVFPASQILLKLKPSPAIVPVRKEHSTIELIQIGGCLCRGQSGSRDRKQAAHERLRFLNSGGCMVGFAHSKEALRLPVHCCQLLNCVTVPGFLGLIRGRTFDWSGRWCATGENRDRRYTC